MAFACRTGDHHGDDPGAWSPGQRDQNIPLMQQVPAKGSQDWMDVDLAGTPGAQPDLAIWLGS